MYKDIIKPVMDRAVGALLLIILLPILLILSIIILIHLRSFPFYVQPRPGHHGKIFYLIKFKTMKDTKNTDGDLLQDFERTTKLGRVLRKSSLDELPEIINIVLGQMSFVGPRPLLIEYLPLYSNQQKRRHTVKPGLTGLAQVSGRNQLSWEEKFRFDINYIENISFIMDLKILLKTVLIIFKTNEVNRSEQVTMTKFSGTNKRHKGQ
tara:strand:- start:266 stop:889 length:624 start_codon:yes stop_codon:yes gene_type:complete